MLQFLSFSCDFYFNFSSQKKKQSKYALGLWGTFFFSFHSWNFADHQKLWLNSWYFFFSSNSKTSSSNGCPQHFARNQFTSSSSSASSPTFTTTQSNPKKTTTSSHSCVFSFLLVLALKELKLGKLLIFFPPIRTNWSIWFSCRY